MDWKNTIFADSGRYFVSNPLPEKGETITLWLRICEWSPVKQIILRTKLNGVEVMGRDISIVSGHPASLNPAIRSIIGADSQIDTSKSTVRFALNPRKVFLFDHETEERMAFSL